MDDPILIAVSALQHYVYCPRQCGLIHLEAIYDESLHTLEGSEVHDRAHELTEGTVRDVPFKSGLPVWSDKLGLNGQADIVEMRPDGPYPVEYKRGSAKCELADETQLCAQALCLEEMGLGAVAKGAIYRHQTRARYEVEITSELREHTLRVIAQVRQMLETRIVPPPVADERCPNCSLRDACLPEPVTDHERQQRYRQELFEPKEGGQHEAEP